MNVPLNPVEQAFLCLAVGTVGGVYLRVPKPYCHMLERPAFAPRVHRDRHRRAGAEGREQKVVWGRSCVRPACGCRLIGPQTV
jgi:hypothetical protein